MRRCSMVSVEELRCVSTCSAAELTLTVSWVPATASVTGKSAICPTVMVWMEVFFAKPGASTTTEYFPGGSARIRYSPSLFVAVERSNALASSRAVTVALVTTAPLRSFTVTCRSPVAAPWENANMRSNNIAEASRTSWRVFINISSDNPDFYRRMARALLAVGEQERGCCWEGDPLLCTINRKAKASYKQLEDLPLRNIQSGSRI